MFTRERAPPSRRAKFSPSHARVQLRSEINYRRRNNNSLVLVIHRRNSWEIRNVGREYPGRSLDVVSGVTWPPTPPNRVTTFGLRYVYKTSIWQTSLDVERKFMVSVTRLRKKLTEILVYHRVTRLWFSGASRVRKIKHTKDVPCEKLNTT